MDLAGWSVCVGCVCEQRPGFGSVFDRLLGAGMLNRVEESRVGDGLHVAG